MFANNKSIQFVDSFDPRCLGDLRRGCLSYIYVVVVRIPYPINIKTLGKLKSSLRKFIADIQIVPLFHSKFVINTLFLLSGLSLAIRIDPPLVRLIGPRPLSLLVNLIPRLRAKYIVNVLYLVVPPDLVVHALPTQRLKRVVSVGQRNPPPAVQV